MTPASATARASPLGRRPLCPGAGRTGWGPAGRCVFLFLAGIVVVTFFYAMLGFRSDDLATILRGPWLFVARYAQALGAHLGLWGSESGGWEWAALRDVGARFLATLLLTGAAFCVALLAGAGISWGWPRIQALLAALPAGRAGSAGAERQKTLLLREPPAESSGILLSVLRLPSFVIAIFVKALADLGGASQAFWDHLEIRFGICVIAVGLGGGMLPDLLQILRQAGARARTKGYADAARVSGDRVTRHVWPEMFVPVLDYAFSRSLDVLGGVIAVEYIIGFPGIGQMLLSHFLMKYSQTVGQAEARDRVFLGLLLIVTVGLLIDPLRLLILRKFDPRYGPDERA